MSLRYVRFSPRAINDLFSILHFTQKKFGPLTSVRYKLLIDQSILDVLEDANRFGVQAQFDLKYGLFFYHMKNSKRSVTNKTARIVTPRHLLVFRLPSAKELHVIRILHERMKFSDQDFPIEYIE